MNKDKILYWLAEQVFHYDINNKPFKYFKPVDFDINEEEWKKTMHNVEYNYNKDNGYLEEEE